jgi:formate/nitrite transporter
MHGFDALLPPEMAQKAELVGAQKARLDWLTLFTLAILAGAFVAFGALFATTVLAGTEGTVPFGISRLIAGTVFCLGLVLVIAGGAELFTGNTLIVMAWAAGEIRARDVARVWAIVYAGNFVGAMGTAVLVLLSGQYLAGGGAVAEVALRLAHDKATLPFDRALFLGILCNVLVCLAVWLSFGARTTTDKVLAVVFPGVGVRRRRLRAFGRQHVPRALRPAAQGLGAGRFVDANGDRRCRLRGPDVACLLVEPGAGHGRQRHRRRRAGWCRLLVRLSAACTATGLTACGNVSAPLWLPETMAPAQELSWDMLARERSAQCRRVAR